VLISPIFPAASMVLTISALQSDIVAHLVLAHQTQMHNLITLTNYQTRIAQFKQLPPEAYRKPAEELVRHLLFANEAPLTQRVTGDTDCAHQFAAQGYVIRKAVRFASSTSQKESSNIPAAT